jgi:hypothetical protein
MTGQAGIGFLCRHALFTQAWQYVETCPVDEGAPLLA